MSHKTKPWTLEKFAMWANESNQNELLQQKIIEVESTGQSAGSEICDFIAASLAPQARAKKI